MSEFEEILGLLKSGEITEAEADELLADVDYSQVQEYTDRGVRAKGEKAVNKATADAKAFLLDRTDRLKSVGLSGSLSGEFEGLDHLPNSRQHPQPYVQNRGKYGQVLYGTEYEVNDVTGTKMPVPSVDPTDSKKPLGMFVGSREQAAKNTSPVAKEFLDVENASEYTQRQILRRMGFPAQMNNQGDVRAPDFTAGRTVIDGQIRKGGDNKMQAYTWVDPTDSRFDFNKGHQERWDEARRVQGSIEQAADADPNANLKQIVERIGDPSNPDRQLTGPSGDRPIEGKLYVEDPRFKKDSVFYTHLTPEQAKAGQFSDTTSHKPQDIDMVHVKKAQEVAENLTGEDLKASLKINPNNPGPVVDRATGKTKFPKRTQINLDIPARFDSEYKETGVQLLKKHPAVGQFLDQAGKLMRNPAVKATGLALGAIPVLGDAADAATGTYDAVTKEGDQQVRGAGNAVAGITGLASVAAPAAAPVLAPISVGLGVGNLAADITKERRARDKKYTANTGSVDPFIHSEEAPVTIQAPTPRKPVSTWQGRREARGSGYKAPAPTPAPSAPPPTPTPTPPPTPAVRQEPATAAVTTETQRRRNARRSTGGVKSKPTTAGGWWNKALDAVKNWGK